MGLQRVFLIAVSLLLVGIFYLMLDPFVGYFLAALIIAFILRPLHLEMKKFLPESVSAFFLVIFAIFVAIIPLFLVTAAVIDDVQELAGAVDDIEVIDFEPIEQIILQYTGQQIDLAQNLEDAITSAGTIALGEFTQLVNFVFSLALGLFVMLFTLYYLLKDGEDFLSFMRGVIPVDPEIQDRIYEETEKTTWAVIKGHVLVALAQGLVAGVGLWVTGVPNPIFWTFVMTILAFIPIIGASLVWFPASIYLILVGDVFSGLFLFMYGFVVVSLTDNVLRPLVVDRTADLHPAVVLFGVIGGVYIFGAAGLFFGPILIGVLQSVLKVVQETYEY